MRNLNILVNPGRYFSVLLWGLVFLPYALSAYDNKDGVTLRFHTIFSGRLDKYVSYLQGGSTLTSVFPFDKENGYIVANYSLDKLGLRGNDNENQQVGAIIYKPRWYYAPSILFNTSCNEAELISTPKDRFLFFQGNGKSFLSRYYFSWDIFRFRVGLGAGVNVSWLKKMVQKKVDLGNDDHRQNFVITYDYRFFISSGPLALLGIKMWRTHQHAMFLDCMWLPVFFFHSEAGTKYYWKRLYDSDLGITWESKINNYLSYSVRLAYELAYLYECTIFSDEENRENLYQTSSQANNNNITVHHQFNGIALHVGMSVLLPDKRHCTIPGCQAKYDHNHSGKFYRGHECVR